MVLSSCDSSALALARQRSEILLFEMAQLFDLLVCQCLHFDGNFPNNCFRSPFSKRDFHVKWVISLRSRQKLGLRVLRTAWISGSGVLIAYWACMVINKERW